MPSDRRDLHGVQASLEQPAGRFVAQIVEAQVLEPGSGYSASPDALYAVQAAPSGNTRPVSERGEDASRRTAAGKRGRSRVAVFGVREKREAAVQVDVVPFKPEHFASLIAVSIANRTKIGKAALRLDWQAAKSFSSSRLTRLAGA